MQAIGDAMGRRRHSQTHLVTSAPRSPDEEFEARKRRYVFTMLARAILLVVALLTATISIWLAIGIGLISMVLPWIAVVMANDGPPRKNQPRPAAKDKPAPEAPTRRVIAAGPVVIDENGATVRKRDEEGDSA